jgi:hypothetical protein
MKELKGRCLCGAVEYAVPDALHYSGYCHCSDCRRFSGSAFSAMGGVPLAELRILKGADHIARYTKSAQTVLCFCRACGSSLYAEKPQRGMAHLRLGTLDEAPSLPPQFHSYVASKAPWYPILDTLPQHPAGRAAAQP